LPVFFLFFGVSVLPAFAPPFVPDSDFLCAEWHKTAAILAQAKNVTDYRSGKIKGKN
jgi:hypothetical protein